MILNLPGNAVPSQPVELDTTHWPSGVYIIEVKAGKKWIIEKVVKQ
jgi:hypothetical protein